MGKEKFREIERKFLVKGEYKSQAYEALPVLQGYLSSVPERNVRVRLCGEKAWLTIKGPATDDGLSRFEWEKEIEPEEARQLMALCEPGIIDKTRYRIESGAHTYEVDEFYGDNEGLVVAEIELSEEKEEFNRPDWLGEEVTGDRRYYNSSLIKFPYKKWSKEK